MNKFKYILTLLLVINFNIKAENPNNLDLEEKTSTKLFMEETDVSENNNTNLTFEEYIKDKTANDYNKISILFDIYPDDKNPEIWENVFQQVVESIKELGNWEKDAFEQIKELLALIYTNYNNLHGDISIGINPKEIGANPKENVKK